MYARKAVKGRPGDSARHPYRMGTGLRQFCTADGRERWPLHTTPAKQFDIKVWDVEYRRDPVRTLMARIYQPQGAGPFLTLLDVHGGAWNDQDRTANAPVDERLAASGILVVAIDVRLAREAPYPASVADANYGVRWLKSKAREWHGDPETLGTLGSSSGGHVMQPCAMRPHDARYTMHPLPEAPHLDATLTHVIARSPISDPAARYEQAQKMQRESLITNSKIYFNPWESILRATRSISSHAASRSLCRRCSSCKAHWTTTCFRRYKSVLSRPTEPPVATSTWRFSQVLITAGLFNRVCRQTAPST